MRERRGDAYRLGERPAKLSYWTEGDLRGGIPRRTAITPFAPRSEPISDNLAPPLAALSRHA